MSENSENKNPDDRADEETPREDAAGPDAAGQPETLHGPDRLAELEQQVADLNDKLLRAVAETENVRRRARREKEDASKYAIAGFAGDLVSVADNLTRALDSIDSETRAADKAVDNLMAGIEMTLRELFGSFERTGIKRIEALDKPFDHNLHEALFELEDPEKPLGTVVQVVQQGYTIRDRLLRPAKVGVSKGGPKAPPPTDAATADADAADRARAEETAREKAPEQTKAYQHDKQGPGAKLDEEL